MSPKAHKVWRWVMMVLVAANILLDPLTGMALIAFDIWTRQKGFFEKSE